MGERTNQMPEHVKRKILMFFAETSVPRIIEAKKEQEKLRKDEAV